MRRRAPSSRASTANRRGAETGRTRSGSRHSAATRRCSRRRPRTGVTLTIHSLSGTSRWSKTQPSSADDVVGMVDRDRGIGARCRTHEVVRDRQSEEHRQLDHRGAAGSAQKAAPRGMAATGLDGSLSSGYVELRRWRIERVHGHVDSFCWARSQICAQRLLAASVKSPVRPRKFLEAARCNGRHTADRLIGGWSAGNGSPASKRVHRR